jgi:sugar-specific transcriptional regulator TrmB
MLNNKNTLLLNLHRLGLSADECRVYLALLDEPMSRLEVARKTGINRTKVYRVADMLIRRGLVSEETNSRGRELAASDPVNLEIVITTEEEKIKSQRQLLSQTLPILNEIYTTKNRMDGSDFVINTYEGVDGFKQMLWNELKAENEVLVFGSGTLQDLVGSSRWAEKHREKTITAGYTIREILNPDGKPDVFTKNTDFMSRYMRRNISSQTLPLHHQISIYNNTVAIYNWRNEQKVGVEIVNKSYADTQRSMFEHYWPLGTPA